MSDRIAVKSEMWRDRGEWKLLVRAPEWIVNDFARHATLDRHKRVWVHNFGGGLGEYSFLLGTQRLVFSRRERFARWLLRIPSPKLSS